MRTPLLLLAFLLLAGRAGAQLPSVPGHDVAVYATVTDPTRISFDRETGALYAGRDNTGSGGGNGDPVKVHRIGPGGSPVVEYGTATIGDPDAVMVDAGGTASEGAAGSVIVGGVDVGGTQGQLTAVRPDESVQLIDGPTTTYDNPTDFAVDSTGRVVMTDARLDGTGQVLVVTGTGTPTVLIPTSVLQNALAAFIAVDAQDRIFVSQSNGTVQLFDSTGAVLDATYATGLGSRAPLAVGPGGPFGTDLYAIDDDVSTLVRIDPQGMVTTIGSGFGDVQDLEFGPDGALYVSEFDQDRILRIEAPFSSEWDGSAGMLPDEVCPAWTSIDTATPEDPVLAAGTLTLATSTNAENMAYIQTAPDVSIPDLLIIEARMRLVFGSSSAASRAPGFIGFTTAPGVGGLFFVGTDEIFLTTTGDVKGDSAAVDTDDAAHTYRIVVDGTADGSAITVFYDGVSTLTGAVYMDPTNFGATERIFWGEGSIQTTGTLEWEYAHHNAAICTTSTTTTTSSSTSTSTTSTSTSTSSASSSSTSSSSSTATPTTVPPTTTTLPTGGCNGIADGATFSSLLCRVQALYDRVNAEAGLGAFQPKLAKTLDTTIGRLRDGQTLCGESNLKKTRKRLQQAGKGLASYAHRLKGRPARKQLDDALRQDFLAAGEAIAPDVAGLRSTVACAAGAGS